MSSPRWIIEKADARLVVVGGAPAVANDDWWDRALIDDVGGADEVWLEVEAPAGGGPSPLIGELGLAHDTPLPEIIGTERLAVAAAAASLLGLAPEDLVGLRPWLAAQVLERALYAAATSDGEATPEARLRGVASEAGIPLRFELEFDAAIRMFADLSPEAELSYFDHVVATIGDGPAGVDERAREWSAGDMTGVIGEERRMRVDAPAFHAVAVGQRNRAWVPRVVEMMDVPGRRVACVGAIHMVGPGGIPALLEGEDIEVTRV